MRPAKGFQSGTGLGKRVGYFEQITRGVREAVELPDDNRVALAEMPQHLGKLRSFAPCAGYLLLEDALASGSFQFLKLDIEMLIFGRYACVADIHGTNHKAVAKVVAEH